MLQAKLSFGRFWPLAMQPRYFQTYPLGRVQMHLHRDDANGATQLGPGNAASASIFVLVKHVSGQGQCRAGQRWCSARSTQLHCTASGLQESWNCMLRCPEIPGQVRKVGGCRKLGHANLIIQKNGSQDGYCHVCTAAAAACSSVLQTCVRVP